MEKLDKVLLLDKIRTILIITGCFLAFIGLSCLPLGWRFNPKVDSVFLYAADTGMFLKVGIVFIIVGIVICIIAGMIPSLKSVKKNKETAVQVVEDKQAAQEEFKVIINPKRFHLSGPVPWKLLVCNDHLIFERRGDKIDIPYTSITSVRFEKNKACLSWNSKELSFGVSSKIRTYRVDISRTKQVANLISKHLKQK